MDAWVASLTALASSPWVFLALYVAVVADAFLVVIPSEVAVATLGALSAATGEPPMPVLIPVAAVGALTGDLLCSLIGRRVGLDRWRWQREGKSGAAIARVRDTVLRRPALLIVTGRYVPFARIAVNLSVGAARLPLARYLPISAVSGLFWALYNIGIGTIFGNVFHDQPIIAILCTMVVAITLGLVVDRCATAIRAYSQRRAQRGDDAPRSST